MASIEKYGFFLTLLACGIILGAGSIILPPYVTVVGCVLMVVAVLFTIRITWAHYMVVFLVLGPNASFIYAGASASMHKLLSVGNFQYTYFLYLCMVLAWSIRSYARLEQTRYLEPVGGYLAGCIFFLVGWNFCSLFWTVNTFLGFAQFVLLVMNIVVFSLFCYTITTTKKLKNLVRVILFAGILLGLVALISVKVLSLPSEVAETNVSADLWSYNYNLPYDIKFNTLYRIQRARGTAFGSPHSLGLTMSFLMAVGMGVMLSINKEKIWIKVLLSSCLIFFLSAHVTTLSKGATVSLFAMVVFYLILSHKLRAHFIKNSLVFMFSYISVFVLVHSDSLFHSMKRYSVDSTSEVSLSTRLEFWKTILPPFFETLGRGLGIGGGKALLPVSHEHNIYISVLCDMGIIGTCIIGFLTIKITKDIISVINQQDTFSQNMLIASSATIFAALVHGLVDFNYNFDTLWMIAGFHMAALRLARTDIARKTNSIKQKEEK